MANRRNQAGKSENRRSKPERNPKPEGRNEQRYGLCLSSGCGWRFHQIQFICVGMRSTITTMLTLGWALAAGAQIHTETIEYRDGDAVLEGYLAYDTSIQGKRPGVLIVHQ